MLLLLKSINSDKLSAYDLRNHLDKFSHKCAPPFLGLPKNTHFISLAAKDEAELAKLELTLIERNIPHVAIREPDRDNELCSIGIVPCQRDLVKKILQKYPLSGRT